VRLDIGLSELKFFFGSVTLNLSRVMLGFYLAHTNYFLTRFLFFLFFCFRWDCCLFDAWRDFSFLFGSFVAYLLVFLPFTFFVAWVNSFRHLILFLRLLSLPEKKEEKKKRRTKIFGKEKRKNVEENIGIIYFWEKYFSLLFRTKFHFFLFSFLAIVFLWAKYFLFSYASVLSFFFLMFSSFFFFPSFFSFFSSPLGAVCSHN